MIGELIQVYKELSNRNHGIALVWEIICLFFSSLNFSLKHMPSSCPLSANLWSLLFNLQASKLFSEDCKWTRECGYHVSMILRLISDNVEQVNKITNILLVGFSINLSKSQLGEWNCDTTKNDELRVRLSSTLWITNLSILISKICIGSSPEIVQIRAFFFLSLSLSCAKWWCNERRGVISPDIFCFLHWYHDWLTWLLQSGPPAWSLQVSKNTITGLVFLESQF